MTTWIVLTGNIQGPKLLCASVSLDGEGQEYYAPRNGGLAARRIREVDQQVKTGLRMRYKVE